LLLLELSFKLDVLFLELTNHVFLELDLFNHLHKRGIGLASFFAEFVPLFLHLGGVLHHLLQVLLVGCQLFLYLLFLVF